MYAIYADQLGWLTGGHGAAYMAVPWSVWVLFNKSMSFPLGIADSETYHPPHRVGLCVMA